MENKKSQRAPALRKAPTEPKPPKLSPTVNTPAPAPKAPAPKAPITQPQKAQAPVTPTTKGKVTKESKGLLIQPWHLIVSLIVVLALVVGGVALGRFLGDENTEDPIVDYTGTLVNNSPADPNGITLPGYPTLTFIAGRQKVALELPNPSGNPCYFRYTLTLAETGEVIYQSVLLKPGEAIETLTLNSPLRAGTYTLRITIDTFSLTDGITPMNGGVQEVILNVK